MVHCPDHYRCLILELNLRTTPRQNHFKYTNLMAIRVFAANRLCLSNYCNCFYKIKQEGKIFVKCNDKISDVIGKFNVSILFHIVTKSLGYG